MKINKALNLIQEAEIDGVTVWIHSTPISHEIFEKYFRVLSKTMSTIYSEGHHITAPKIAALMLKEIAQEMGRWSGKDGVESGLMNEIRRLTNLVIPGKQGWETLPFFVAVQSEQISAEDAAEIEGMLVFFTLASAIHGQKNLEMAWPLIERWGGQSTYLSSTEYAHSLRILTEGANSLSQE